MSRPAASLKRQYLQLGRRQVHVLHGGFGAPLLLVHPLPLCTRSLRGRIAPLSHRCAVIAPDIAGCGLSDPLEESTPSADAYVADLLRIVDALGLHGRFAVCGVEEGAVLAIALAAHSPERVSALILDDAVLWRPDEAASFLSDGLPDYAPEISGAHLVRLWHAVRQRYLFHPPQSPSRDNRRRCDMASPDMLTDDLLGYLRAGPAHRASVLAVATASPITRLRDVTAPVMWVNPPSWCATLVSGMGSGRPAIRASANAAEAADQVASFIEHALPGHTTSITASSQTLCSSGFGRQFIEVPGGHIHAVVSSGGAGRPVLALHDPAGSHSLVLPFVAGMAQSRPVVALDLPGNGESDYVVESSEPSSDDYATAVLAASDALGLEELDVVGRYSGAPIGMQMSFRRPAQVKHLALVGVELYSSQRVEELLRHYTPAVEPSPDGAHLALAWHMMSSQSLYWPWYRQLHDHVVSGEPQRDAGVIHQRVFDLLRVGNRYRDAYRALWTYPMEQRLPLLSVPTLLCAPRWDPLFGGLEACNRAAPHLSQLTLPDRFESWPEALMQFFDTALTS